MSRVIPHSAVDFIAEHEALRLVAYDDLQPNRRVFESASQVKGRATIGYGHTGTVTAQDVVNRKRITEAEARSLLSMDLAEARSRLHRVVQPDVIASLTDNQYAALLSFVFNLGANPGWTIWRNLNARQYDQVPAQMARFVHAGGKKLQGLVNRRNAEIALWSREEPGSLDMAPPSSVTRSVDTPPTPAPQTPAQKDPVVVGGALAGIGGIGALAPYLQHLNNPWAFAAFAVILIGLFLIVSGRIDLKRKAGA